ncbi:MAG: pilin [Candidatus Pacebacteria bacterium]|nr:pilin [Candidatus Paceibacterota bacterium]
MKKILFTLICLLLVIFTIQTCSADYYDPVHNVTYSIAISDFYTSPNNPSPGDTVYVSGTLQSHSSNTRFGLYDIRVRFDFGQDSDGLGWNYGWDKTIYSGGPTVSGRFHFDETTYYLDDQEHIITVEACYLIPGGNIIWSDEADKVCETFTTKVSPSTTLCPNGIIDPEEECDGSNFNGKTCVDYGFTEGNLQCNENCLIDTSKCVTTEEPNLPDRYPNALLWENIIDFLKYIVIWIFRIGSGLALLMMLIGAFIMATSAGDRNRAEKGKRTVIWAIIGFVVTMTVNGIIALVQALVGFENI